ncbi:hypothetical protein NQ317_005053 [Molorchus minor]|uniref:ubiquitinyl hydrolase 1 n=1 Tax=Molorchus minor TaxID=1323400 RepID=A0ABQ9JZ20_9CUCU|nr:hypothetical protein NQ317_005053 [Molorchus minor]
MVRIKPNLLWDRTFISLFGVGQDKATFEDFRAWIIYNKDATVLSKWLLSYVTGVFLSSSELAKPPRFYPDASRRTHLEEQDICGSWRTCFWAFADCSSVCFKIFDMDRDCYLNVDEVQHMTQTLLFIANENKLTSPHIYTETVQKHGLLIENAANDVQKSLENELVKKHGKSLESLNKRLDEKGGLTQEDFLVWSVENNSLVSPLLELLFQVCHLWAGWRGEERRGYHVGQFWYLISSDWWGQWVSYTTAPRSNLDYCNCRNEPRIPIEEGIVCDESLLSNTTDYTSTSNELNSNSMESMGDLFSRGDSCSIASSSGVSSSSGTGPKRSLGQPGPIDNTNLVSEPIFKVPTLTGEGGRLRRDMTLVQRRDFELLPDSLWKALSMWYGGPPAPSQAGDKASGQVGGRTGALPGELEDITPSAAAESGKYGDVEYGAAALSAGLTSTVNAATRRYLAHTAAFSRLASVQQVTDFLCHRLAIRPEEARLWLLREHSSSLLDDDIATLQDLAIADGDQILLEVRNKDLTWPEELGQLVASGGHDVGLSVERRPTICLPPGATGLHNLGNTCFMNAALQAVSNTRPLTLYFQRDNQLTELNSVNPLGTKGAVARRYAELCRELWAGSTRSVAPLKLRLLRD